MKIKLLLIAVCSGLVASVGAEMHIWNLNNGKILEAEFVSFVGGTVSLKNMKGKLVKVPESEFSSEDISYIDMLMPPKLDLSLAKSSRVRVFPDSLTAELPSSQYHTFRAVIKQESSRQYPYELTAELFVIGGEKIGDKYILLDYQKEAFTLTDGSKSVFELTSRTVELMTFTMNGQKRGEEYVGFMIVVTDPRGEVIALNTKRNEWFQTIVNLRALPVGKYFDKEGNRSFPTRPKRFY